MNSVENPDCVGCIDVFRILKVLPALGASAVLFSRGRTIDLALKVVLTLIWVSLLLSGATVLNV